LFTKMDYFSNIANEEICMLRSYPSLECVAFPPITQIAAC
jgi:hypothetical protein